MLPYVCQCVGLTAFYHFAPEMPMARVGWIDVDWSDLAMPFVFVQLENYMDEAFVNRAFQNISQPVSVKVIRRCVRFVILCQQMG